MVSFNKLRTKAEAESLKATSALMQCSIPYLVGILDMVNARGVEMLTALTNDESVDPYIRESVLSALP